MMTKKRWNRLGVSLVQASFLMSAVGISARADGNCTNDCRASSKGTQESSREAPIRTSTTLIDRPLVMSDFWREIALTEVGVRAGYDDAKQAAEGLDAGNAPLSVAIVVETGSRIEGLLPAIRRSGVLLTQDVLGPIGEATLIGYNDEVDQLLDFTSDDNAIEKAVGNIQMGTPGAHLYDALSQAVVLLRTRSSSRHRRVR